MNGQDIKQGNRIPNPDANHAVDATTAFAKDGNEIEVTDLADEGPDHYTEDCKTARKTVVFTLLYKLDKSQGAASQVGLTFRGIVVNGSITAPDGNTSVDRYDLDSYGKDIRIVSFLEEVKPDVTVTLTHAQAEAIAALGGYVGGNRSGYRGHAESGLVAIGEALGYEPDSYGCNYEQSPAYSKSNGSIRFTD